MQEITGTSNRILDVDLTAKSFSVYEVSGEDLRLYLGGKGLALKLLYDRMKPGVDPLGEDNMVAFHTGVLMGTGAPCSGRFAAVTKSPLTGIMTSCSCGGPFGMSLKTSGWDGLLIRGTAKSPVYLYIDSKGVEFRDAKKLWGMDTRKVQQALAKDPGEAIVIGPAGENLVRYANVASGHRFLGRGGMGAVFGSKKLKGIVAKGKEFKIVPVKKNKFDRTKKKATDYINRNDVSANGYRNFGTNANVNLNNAGGILPVRNFTGGTHGEAHKISGEEMAEKFKTTYSTCKPCTILCGHKGNIGGEVRQIPEYETIGLMGSNLEIFDPVKISDFNEICTLMGMDTITAGGTIAWAMEATERGLIKSGLKFGSDKGVIEILKEIAYMKGLGKDLARGSRYCSKKYGGEDFAIQVKGLEMAAYDPRGSFGQGLSYAVANRGACHLASTSFALEVYQDLIEAYSYRSKASLVKFQEDIMSAINGLQTCVFTAFPYQLETPLMKYSPRPVLKFMMNLMAGVAMRFVDISIWPELWSSVTGRRLGMTSFLRAGERAQVLERHMNCAEGISRKDDTLPARLLNEFRKCDSKQRPIPLEKMLNRYYLVRGFDKNGIPRERTLRKLKIKKMAV
ncbi:MAG TPA: aldehyde ferredoxin oxidoreductase family protein [Spirochaetota bacterium]|nr:aldehyde ferredoxin oxidoreductase family protein [Spirochaetota bacterium]HPJ34257.1 aldehyde ferredoxin oxidoreductase family protein [Spirochaetota bacterium]